MLKGVTAQHQDPFAWSSFARTSWTHPEGIFPSFILEARVYNVNMVNWTVDVRSVFDQRLFMDVQIGSPYMHPTSGEGFYCVPEIGAKCYILIPSDGAPPAVLCFIMPQMTLSDTSSEEAPAGTAPQGGSPKGSKDFTFAGGRTKGKPGDIVMRGRDGNFMILHRGGVAQFGAGPLAQRICVPLTNLVTDISQNYNHFNSGGSINWGIQDRGSSNPGAELRQTQRVYANDEFADIRFAYGRVRSPVPEPSGDAGMTSDLSQLGIGTDDETVFEFALAKDGFETDAGEFKGESSDVYFRVFFDRGGNAAVRFEGGVHMRVKERLRLRVDDNIEVFGKKTVIIEAEQLLQLLGAKGVKIGTDGGAITLNGGSKAVAHVGSTVKMSIAPPGIVMMAIVPPATAPQPVTIVSGILNGVVLSGNPTILV